MPVGTSKYSGISSNRMYRYWRCSVACLCCFDQDEDDRTRRCTVLLTMEQRIFSPDHIRLYSPFRIIRNLIFSIKKIIHEGLPIALGIIHRPPACSRLLVWAYPVWIGIPPRYPALFSSVSVSVPRWGDLYKGVPDRTAGYRRQLPFQSEAGYHPMLSLPLVRTSPARNWYPAISASFAVLSALFYKISTWSAPDSISGWPLPVFYMRNTYHNRAFHQNQPEIQSGNHHFIQAGNHTTQPPTCHLFHLKIHILYDYLHNIIIVLPLWCNCTSLLADKCDGTNIRRCIWSLPHILPKSILRCSGRLFGLIPLF